MLAVGGEIRPYLPVVSSGHLARVVPHADITAGAGIFDLTLLVIPEMDGRRVGITGGGGGGGGGLSEICGFTITKPAQRHRPLSPHSGRRTPSGLRGDERRRQVSLFINTIYCCLLRNSNS